MAIDPGADLESILSSQDLDVVVDATIGGSSFKGVAVSGFRSVSGVDTNPKVILASENNAVVSAAVLGNTVIISGTSYLIKNIFSSGWGAVSFVLEEV